MKRKLILLCIVFVVVFDIKINAQNTPAYTRHAAFALPNDSTYLETYISIPYENIIFKKSRNNLFYGNIQLVLIYKTIEDKIIGFEKVNLLTEELDDTTNQTKTLIELFRKQLPMGNYKVEIELVDTNDETLRKHTWTDAVSITQPNTGGCFSDIELLDRYEATLVDNQFTKGKMDLIPYSVNYYPTSQSVLKFYCELYHVQEQNDLIIQYSIRNPYTNTVVQNIGGKQRSKGSNVVPVIGELDLTSLPTGSYQLYLEVIDKSKNILSSKRFVFFRSNDSLPDPVLSSAITEYDFTQQLSAKESYHLLQAMRNIASDVEHNQIVLLLDAADTSKYKPFIFNFWLRRNVNEPTKPYTEFVQIINKADELYTCLKVKGYATDRGKILTKYGPPDFHIQRNNNGAYSPYEIWTYNTIGNQFKCKFVFIDPEISGCDFRMLHTTVRGYATLTDWKNQLVNRSVSKNNKSNFSDSNNDFLNNSISPNDLIKIFMEDYNR